MYPAIFAKENNFHNSPGPVVQNKRRRKLTFR